MEYLKGIPQCCGHDMCYKEQLFTCGICFHELTDGIIYQTNKCNVEFLIITHAIENYEPTYMVVFHDDETYCSYSHGIQFADHKPCKGLAPYERYLEKGHFSFDPKKMRTSKHVN